MRIPARLLPTAALGLASLTLAACTGVPGPGAETTAQETRSAPASGDSFEIWAPESVHGRWRVVFDGYGTVRGTANTVILEPRVARQSDITHGALVVDENAPAEIDASVTLRTEQQLRTPEPNPWEVGWVLWRYQDPNHFYAIALKPNGWELSKQDPAYPGSQRFLAAGADPAFPVGQAHTVTIRHRDDTITVIANGAELTTFTDTERPYRDGGLALYTEDARVVFTDFRIDELPDR